MARGFSIFPRPLAKTLNLEKQPPPYGDPPGGWPGSTAEWAVDWALTRMNEDFVYQQSFDGGRQTLGGAVVDFYLPNRQVAIRVQGTYWHYGLGADVMASDQLQKIMLEGQGLVVVDIDEPAALDNTFWVVSEAVQGRDHSRTVLG